MNNKDFYSRRRLKLLIAPYEQKNNVLALSLIFFDYALFLSAEYLVVTLPIFFKMVASFIIFFAMGRLFILGHDLCHGILFDSPKMNKLGGILVFLPTMIPASKWTVSHNAGHHGFTNLSDKDILCCPLSPQEYQVLSSSKKFLYRVYRNCFGSGIYYLTLWWKNLYFPALRDNKSSCFFFDSLVVTVFFVLWLLSLGWASFITNQSIATIWIFGFFLPFLLWGMGMGFIIYLHHTNPRVRWYKNQEEWSDSMPYITAVAHIKFSDFTGFLLHNIMEHTAHHLNWNIPCYNLKAAQQKLEEVLPEHIVVQDFSWKWYLECSRVCKLYDFEKHEWVGFNELCSR